MLGGQVSSSSLHQVPWKWATEWLHPVAVERSGAAKLFLLRRLDRDGERKRLEIRRHGMAQAKEIADWGDHVGRLGIVPVHLDEHLAVVVGVINFVVEAECIVNFHHGYAGLGVGNQAGPKDFAAGLDKPQMRDGARAFQVREHDRLAGQHDKGVLIEAPMIPAGHPSTPGDLSLGHACEEITSERHCWRNADYCGGRKKDDPRDGWGVPRISGGPLLLRGLYYCSQTDTMTRQRASRRRRTTLACDTCRSRRTKCDAQRPSCDYCQTHGIPCIYQELPVEPPSRVEEELAVIHQRLDQVIDLLHPPLEPNAANAHPAEARNECEYSVATQCDSPFDLASKLLGNPSVMHVLGLNADFAQSLLRGERHAESQGNRGGVGGTPMLLVHHQHVVSALAAFSSRAHPWYPILPSDFTSEYFRVLSGSLPPSSESCLSLLVAAVGHVVGDDEAVSDPPYFEAALASLPNIISECSVRSVQCLMLVAFEIGGQLDVPNSDIWSLDELVPLPLCQRPWQFTPESTSPSISPPGFPEIQVSIDTHVEATGSYFLAEIAMRRMLHRCNTAVQVTPKGGYIYAPYIARELEHQLEEWYRHLPDINRFEKGDASQPLELVRIPPSPLSNFLRVQYYCCMMSIYWPAVHQAMQDGALPDLLWDDCKRFLDSYVMLTPSIAAAFQDCHVNRWNLFVSIFLTTVAAVAVASTPCLRELCSPQFYQCILASAHAKQTTLQKSPSLMMLQGVLEQRILDANV
ncbi:putative C6 transcription factor [Aspergillus affinis]|uniref:putative C6 transcription factor n=1 Tax=Aspergillus affinis TaxID=1070780 RepID=UPI0022FE964A|nr:uncharacterized protein KD926_004626 [Aspergillus affinis]KAI9043123.1 hypothetical protein KD926_004626 [Aspergillus affinis]